MSKKNFEDVEMVQATEEVVKDSKAKKAEAAKRFKERRAAEKEANTKDAAELIDLLKSQGSYDGLADNLKNFLNRLANPSRASGGSGRGEIFTALFGADPVVGTTIGLREAFEKTYKSTAELKRAVKNWASKGIVVEVANGATPMDTTFTLVQLA